MNAMLYCSSDQPERYQGRNLDAALSPPGAPAPRGGPVHAYNETDNAAGCVEPLLRRRLHARPAPTRAGRRRGQRTSRLAPSTGRGASSRIGREAWARSDSWMMFLRRKLPRAITFLYMPDEPAPAEYPHILKLAEEHPFESGPWQSAADLRHENPYVEAMNSAGIDIWCSGPKGFPASTASRASARAAASSGSTTAAGQPEAPSPSRPRRPMPAPRSGPPSSTTFESISTGTRCTGVTTARRSVSATQNVWANSITYDNPQATRTDHIVRSRVHPRRWRLDLSGRRAAAS